MDYSVRRKGMITEEKEASNQEVKVLEGWSMWTWLSLKIMTDEIGNMPMNLELGAREGWPTGTWHDSEMWMV